MDRSVISESAPLSDFAEFNSVAVLTASDQLTLPEAVFADFPDVKYFEVSCREGMIVLTPIQSAPIETVWENIAAQGITEADVADAVNWARRG